MTGAEIVEETYAEWYRAMARVPGVEVHDDRDLIWVLHPGSSYGNGGTRPRFTEASVEKRLDRILARYREAGRPFGLWVGPGARPADLDRHLRARGLRCRKHFPAMLCDAATEVPVPAGLGFRVVDDHTLYQRAEHPYLGRITTAIRRFELSRLAALSSLRPRRVWDLVAELDGEPVGACTLFKGSRAAGFFDVGVVERARGRGIGAALMAHGCRFARERGARATVLISSGMGHGMYQRVGFRDVCTIGYWYRAN